MRSLRLSAGVYTQSADGNIRQRHSSQYFSSALSWKNRLFAFIVSFILPSSFVLNWNTVKPIFLHNKYF